MQLVRFIHTYESPLCLRGSLTHLSHQYGYPFLALLYLFVAIPTWHFRLPNLVQSKDILDIIPLFESRRHSTDLINMRSIPIWRARNLNWISEVMTARKYTATSAEVERFWYQVRQSWEVHRIPDPSDSNPIRYAILASIAEELAEAFNWQLWLRMWRDVIKNIYRETLDEELPPFKPEVASY